MEVGSSNLLTPTSLAEVPQQWGDDELSFLGYFLPVSFFERASSGQAPTSLAEVPQQWGDDELSFLGFFLSAF